MRRLDAASAGADLLPPRGTYDEYRLPVPTKSEPFDLVLRRFKPTALPPPTKKGAKPPGAVLLIHGASANSLSFWIPKDGGLATYLRASGWEVWTLDWRGSCDVIQALPGAFIDGSLEEECNLFSLDQVAEWDLPKALDRIEEERRATGSGNTQDPSVAVVAHCFGSGALSMSLARGKLENKGVENVVLSTLGLFYEVTWNGWVKVEDFLIERIMGKVAHDARMPIVDRRAIDSKKTPRRGERRTSGAWPEDMHQAYADWPDSWLPTGATPSDRVFQGLSFMFGRPYQRARNRVPHDLPLHDLFGGMHLGLYLHAGQLVRRGFSDRLNAPDVFDRARLRRGSPGSGMQVGDLDPSYFLDKRITLITGGQNQLWHRDSMDLMYDWMCNQPCKHVPHKRVRPDYAHQDLLWAPAPTVPYVYEWIKEGIERAD